MASIEPSHARPALPPQRTAPPATSIALTEDEPASSTAAMRRTGLHQPSVLHQALAMSDDLAGLVSSMRRNRARGADEGSPVTQAWHEHVLDPKGPEKLAALRLQLDQLPSVDLATLRGLLSALFPDPSDAVAVLRTLRSGAELEELAEVLDALEQELMDGGPAQGMAVRAGLNVALKARLHANRLAASPAQLRQSYREFLDVGEPLESYEEWIALYGFERRSRVVDFIEHAMAADMYALDPSCSRIEFGQLLQRVRQLTTIRSADHLLLACCWDAVMMPRIGVTQPALLSALFALVRQGGGLRSLFDSVFQQVTYALDAADKVRFAQNLRRFLKAVPHGLWQTVEQQVEAQQELEALLSAALDVERQQAGARHWTAV
ncbi:type III secretion system gatekeeper subunit SctW [Stenotrophomonas sp. SORGH_AS_0321]|uniref:type III secretion system gatekeeper subunit SctW n=1 Tax=Stenotrophomonas sp. SORGH_AS_0321 TaxID=3041787 RepID=UPI0028607887|nr:type III secretion system gatekeeper subunit SctW [Stenotrophomonas sp. SORGH_AS_0321]MDR6092741.1 type III secretion system YopN/LcrE/InvE/MxiC family regulator [Stenotrophomonas sp. SORGH_AS_0321]